MYYKSTASARPNDLLIHPPHVHFTVTSSSEEGQQNTETPAPHGNSRNTVDEAAESESSFKEEASLLLPYWKDEDIVILQYVPQALRGRFMSKSFYVNAGQIVECLNIRDETALLRETSFHDFVYHPPHPNSPLSLVKDPQNLYSTLHEIESNQGTNVTVSEFSKVIFLRELHNIEQCNRSVGSNVSLGLSQSTFKESYERYCREYPKSYLFDVARRFGLFDFCIKATLQYTLHYHCSVTPLEWFWRKQKALIVPFEQFDQRSTAMDLPTSILWNKRAESNEKDSLPSFYYIDANTAPVQASPGYIQGASISFPNQPLYTLNRTDSNCVEDACNSIADSSPSQKYISQTAPPCNEQSFHARNTALPLSFPQFASAVCPALGNAHYFDGTNYSDLNSFEMMRYNAADTIESNTSSFTRPLENSSLLLANRLVPQESWERGESQTAYERSLEFHEHKTKLGETDEKKSLKCARKPLKAKLYLHRKGYFRVVWWEGEHGSRYRREKIFPVASYGEFETAEFAAKRFAGYIDCHLERDNMKFEKEEKRIPISTIRNGMRLLNCLHNDKQIIITERETSMIEWYPGVVIPLGGKGRSMLKKALNKKRNANPLLCDEKLALHNLKINKTSSFGYYRLPELLKAAKILDLWPLVQQMCVEGCKKQGFRVEWIPEMRAKGLAATFHNLKTMKLKELQHRMSQKKQIITASEFASEWNSNNNKNTIASLLRSLAPHYEDKQRYRPFSAAAHSEDAFSNVYTNVGNWNPLNQIAPDPVTEMFFSEIPSNKTITQCCMCTNMQNCRCNQKYKHGSLEPAHPCSLPSFFPFEFEYVKGAHSLLNPPFLPNPCAYTNAPITYIISEKNMCETSSKEGNDAQNISVHLPTYSSLLHNLEHNQNAT